MKERRSEQQERLDLLLRSVMSDDNKESSYERKRDSTTLLDSLLARAGYDGPKNLPWKRLDEETNMAPNLPWKRSSGGGGAPNLPWKRSGTVLNLPWKRSGGNAPNLPWKRRDYAAPNLPWKRRDQSAAAPNLPWKRKDRIEIGKVAPNLPWAKKRDMEQDTDGRKDEGRKAEEKEQIEERLLNDIKELIQREALAKN